MIQKFKSSVTDWDWFIIMLSKIFQLSIFWHNSAESSFLFRFNNSNSATCWWWSDRMSGVGFQNLQFHTFYHCFNWPVIRSWALLFLSKTQQLNSSFSTKENIELTNFTDACRQEIHFYDSPETTLNHIRYGKSSSSWWFSNWYLEARGPHTFRLCLGNKSRLQQDISWPGIKCY